VDFDAARLAQPEQALADRGRERAQASAGVEEPEVAARDLQEAGHEPADGRRREDLPAALPLLGRDAGLVLLAQPFDAGEEVGAGGRHRRLQYR